MPRRPLLGTLAAIVALGSTLLTGNLAASAETATVPTVPTVRIDAGASTNQSISGAAWSKDAHFVGGTVSTTGTTTVPDAALYRTGRWNMSAYNIPVANGTYTVKLHFLDHYYGITGKRVFDVTSEGALVLDNFDIAAAAGGKNLPTTRTFTTTVKDGTLNLGFGKVVNNPLVSGITLTPVPVAAVAPVAPVTAVVPGTTKPTATNTGVPAGTALQIVNGDISVTQDGTVIENKDVRGFIRVYAQNVTIKNSIVRGGTPTKVEGVITMGTNARNVLIQDTEVYPSQKSVMLDGIKGGNFTARRVHVHGGVDNIKVHGNNVLIESSYLHEQDYYAADPLQGGGATHNDALQILGGDNIRVVGNTIVGNRNLNAAVQITQDFAPLTRAVITQNWADGGGCTFNANHKKLTELRDLTITNNTFGRDTRYGNCAIILTTKTFPTLSGNRYTDGAAVTPKYMAP